MLLTACTEARPETDVNEKEQPAKEETTVEPKIDINISRAQEREVEKDVKTDEYVHEIALYFLNRTQNSLIAETRRITTSQPGINFTLIIDALSKGPVSPELEAVIPRDTKLLSASHVEDIVTVNLSADFLEAEDLLITRAALVNTLVDIDGIEFVRIMVEGKEITTSGVQEGEVLGILGRFPTDVAEIIAKEKKTDGAAEVRTLDWELFFQDREGKLLLSEIRTINVLNMEYARTIVEELIKGPSAQDLGLYRAIPSGARLLDVELVKSEDPEIKDMLKLVFSQEFAAALAEGTSSFRTSIGSLVLSLTSLSNIGRISIVYDGNVTPGVVDAMEASQAEAGFAREDFSDLLGRRIRVYFSDRNAMHLVPEYRAMNRGDLRIARRIISELIEGPVYEGNIGVMPQGLSIDKIRVWVDRKTAFVDLPQDINLNQMGSTGETMAIYAMVNSLTDPINTRNIERVQFLVGGKVVEGVGHLSLREPFVRNPALVNDK
jgi:spore germination protein GerM